MTREKVTGSICIGELRLAAVDTGFDLRATDTPMRMPDWEFASAGFDQDGEVWLVTGSRDEIVAALRTAGYRIAE